ncbi:Prenyltransferase and squalene oxidase repeat protein [Poriferisphaera corsica]|uniref:Prenyltransferase and squalene oxidase repeat protein n=1 Tax=Poriferisphaera corsica TaxID=2528020 RepID=A0A517YP40_9BACT|nr:prenyltransferase/squalene oxidase repeat-containing protein [Poriferisphaera corsica]QDU31988.1 Prenyltransferase and squalene oxidase repeat protein [Poriferisphaera corsica]
MSYFMVRRWFYLAVMILLMVLVCSNDVMGISGEGRGAEEVGFDEITVEMREAVDRALGYLAGAQAADGSYGSERYPKHVGMTSLAAMAFMADGHLPGRGRYGRNVEKAVDFVLRSAAESGFISADTSHGPMYGHGFATLMLGEVYGMTGDSRVREILIKAVRLIVNTQNHEGGWRYHPIPFDADISVTICQIMALRSARNAGLSVPKETIDRAVKYVRQCQNPADGGFRYMLSSGGSAFPRSAAGVASLFYAGVYEGEDIKRGVNYLMTEGGNITFRSGGHYYYGHYYAGQAMYLAGGQYWEVWYPRIRDELVSKQNEDGSWDSSHGGSYGTSMGLLILQIPNRLLPIFQR